MRRGSSPEPVFETARLRAREMSLDDLDFIASLLSDPEVMRFYPKLYSREEARGWVEKQSRRYEEHGHGLWLILDRQSGTPVGQVGLLTQTLDGVEEPEVGYMIDRRFWRRGYASEAALATRDLAFERFGYPYVISLIRPENVPSQGVARKLGMVSDRITTFVGLAHHVFRVERPA